MRRITVFATLLTAALVMAIPAAAGGGGGCHDGFSSEPTNEIELRLNCFGPTVARVGVGETVTWRNVDDWHHNVYSQAFPSSSTLIYDATHTARFDTPGVYPYVCAIHPTMMGAVVVGEFSSFTDQAAVERDGPTPADAEPKAEVTAPPAGVGTADGSLGARVVDTQVPGAQPGKSDPAGAQLAGSPLAAALAPQASNPDTQFEGAGWLIGAAILAVGIVLGAGIGRRGRAPHTGSRIRVE